MRPELLTALATISEGMTLLRAGNSHHKGSGPGGVQFTSSGSHSLSASSHGKHYAKRQIRRKKRLEQFRKTGHARIAELKLKHAKERKALRGTHREKGTNYADRRNESKALRHRHKGEARQVVDSIKQEIKSRAFGSEVTEFDDVGSGIFPVVERAATVAMPKPRMHSSRIHKANSAEAILRHVLRQRGWTAIYGDGGLTGKRRLNLLEDVRQYSRMYLRHEAESFFDQYGVEIDERGLDGSQRGISGISDPLLGREGFADSSRDQERAQQVGREIVRGLASRAAGAIGRLFDRARGFLREVIVAGAMALKGDEPLTNAEIYALERLTRKQYEYLQKFEQEVSQNPPREIADLSSLTVIVQPPPMTPGQFTARLEQYGNSVWGAGNSLNRDRIRQVPNARRERRYLGHADHCEDCPPLAAQGWQPIGTLPDIGDTECGGQCHCHFEYQDDKGKTFLTPEDYERQTPVKKLPGGPGPQEKPPRKIKLKPEPPEPPPKSNVPTLQELLDEAGSPFPASEYEEA